MRSILPTAYVVRIPTFPHPAALFQWQWWSSLHVGHPWWYQWMAASGRRIDSVTCNWSLPPFCQKQTASKSNFMLQPHQSQLFNLAPQSECTENWLVLTCLYINTKVTVAVLPHLNLKSCSIVSVPYTVRRFIADSYIRIIRYATYRIVERLLMHSSETKIRFLFQHCAQRNRLWKLRIV